MTTILDKIIYGTFIQNICGDFKVIACCYRYRLDTQKFVAFCVSGTAEIERSFQKESFQIYGLDVNLSTW